MMATETIFPHPVAREVGHMGFDNTPQLTRIERRLDDIERALRELLAQQGTPGD